MTAGFWMSISLGVGIGVVYGLSSYLMYKFALRRTDKMFLAIALGGIMVRMFVALMVFTLILALVAVDVRAFAGSFFGIFVIGLVAEVWIFHQQRSGATASRP